MSPFPRTSLGLAQCPVYTNHIFCKRDTYVDLYIDLGGAGEDTHIDFT